MLIKKPSILLATYSCVHSLPSRVSGSSTSSKRDRKSTRQQACRQKYHRSYATIAGGNGRQHQYAEREPHSWPEPANGGSCPTPYQIFAMKTTAAYSKTRYYDLVKLYHPDRLGSVESDITRAIRVERYRLIVAAHTILSDPAKRSAYDRFGAGWNGKAELGGRQTWYQQSSQDEPGPFSQNWSDPNHPIWQNATWEDWDRFYRARRSEGAEGIRRQYHSPLYLRNSHFLLLVVILAVMGSTANYTRAHDAGAYYIEQRDIAHDRASKELRKVKQEASRASSRQSQIDWFLRNREATLGLAGSDSEILRQEKLDRILPDQEICRSEEIVEKDP